MAELERELALELGRDEIGDAEHRVWRRMSCIQDCSSGAPIATSTRERLALGRGHGGDFPAADGAELARDRGLQSIRFGEVARQALLGPGLDRLGIAPGRGERAVRAASKVLSFMADLSPTRLRARE